MIKHYLRHTFRSLKKNKLTTFINIIGLSAGIATFLFIGIYINHEFSYDKFHKNYNNIYKIHQGNSFDHPAPLSTWLKEKYPEIKDLVRLDVDFGGGSDVILEYKHNGLVKKVDAKDIVYAEPSFFEIFDFEIVAGNKNTALTEPYTIVLSEGIAKKLFEKEDPIGKTINFQGKERDIKMDLMVSAIVQDPPSNTSVQFSAITSFATRKAEYPNIEQDWWNWGYPVYVAFKDKVNVENFTKKANSDWLTSVKSRYKPANSNWKQEYSLKLIPLKEVPFYGNSKRQLNYLLLIIGVLVVIMAIVNFISLSLAKSTGKAMDIGIKKVMGSYRRSIINQFAVESITLTSFAAVLAFFIVLLVKPLFQSITGWNLFSGINNIPSLILLIIAGILTIGIISGTYPALYFSSLKPVNILKSRIAKKQKGYPLKHSLIVFQFIISIALISSTLFISKQIHFLKNKDVGFDRSNLIHSRLNDNIKQHYTSFKERLLQNPNILKVATSNTALAQDFPMTNDETINGENRFFYTLTVDPDFVETMGIEIIEGRDFSWDIQSDQYGAMIINETAVKKFDLENPIGAELDMFGNNVKIIGVMKDFHAGSLYKKIPPSTLWVAPWNGAVNIRLDGKNTRQTLAYIEKIWKEYSSGIPFEYKFLDEQYKALYKSEEKFGLLIAYFSTLAIIIACLGLLGLVAATISQSFKEIGVRKVNGAKISDVVCMLNKDFLKWVFIAFIIATPLTLLLMQKWFENFAYKTSISWWVFALAGILTMIIALITVSFQSWKAARRNPVEALRYE